MDKHVSPWLAGLGGAVLLALMAPGTALAEPQTLPGKAQARVIEPLNVQPVTDLRFGRMTPPAAAGTITVTPASGVSTTGGATAAAAVPQYTNGRGAGAFAVFGNRNRYFLYVLPVTATISNGSASMVVDNFVTNQGGRVGLPRLDNTGYAPLLVGARLNVSANQATGDYSGDYQMVVLYL